MRAAEAWLPLGLWAPAMPHVRQGLRAGMEALTVYYSGQPEGDLKGLSTPHHPLWTQARELLGARELDEAGCEKAAGVVREFGELFDSLSERS